MNKVLPSILGVKDVESFLDILIDLKNKQISDINSIHVDIMDGIFVENKCVDLSVIKHIKEKEFIADVHLMVESPKELIEKAIGYGADNITIHYEIKNFYDMLKLLLKYREKYNINVGVSICPETDTNVLEPILDKIDSVLVMSVHPGKGGQAFIEDSYSKIGKLRNLSKNIRIVVDGGVNNSNIEKILKNGADNVVVGSYITADITSSSEKIQSLMLNLENNFSNKYNHSIEEKRYGKMKKIAVMTAGGDCCGLNAAIKTIVCEANKKGIDVVGILDGYKGFIEKRYKNLTLGDVNDIENLGGTILGSSNKECPFYYLVDKEKNIYEDLTNDGIKGLKELDVEGLIVIGGDGTLDSARVINERGFPTIGIPKTIDNDMVASNPTIGFDTSVNNNIECISKLKSTAYSHNRAMVVEIMGRTSGYLALYTGFASGADVILLPERDYNFDIVCDRVKEAVASKRYAIVCVSEAAKEIGKQETILKMVEDSFEQKRYGGVSENLAKAIEAKTGIETRNLILGHMQRGGETLFTDIVRASLQADYALELLLNGETGYIVGIEDFKLKKMQFPKIRVPRTLDFDNNELIKTAKNMGISFGI